MSFCEHKIFFNPTKPEPVVYILNWFNRSFFSAHSRRIEPEVLLGAGYYCSRLICVFPLRAEGDCEGHKWRRSIILWYKQKPCPSLSFLKACIYHLICRAWDWDAQSVCLDVLVICAEMFVRIAADSQALVYISRCLKTQSTDNRLRMDTR